MPCVLAGSPLCVSSFVFFPNLFSTTSEVSFEFPLCVSQKLDRYFCMDCESFLGVQVGVYCG